MKKILVLAVVILLSVVPLSFANTVCDSVDSSDYLTSAGARLVRGIGNAALCWVEVFRQPMINENKWEGVGRGFVYTGIRGIAGALEAATAIVPGAKIPQPDPACPTDLLKTSS